MSKGQEEMRAEFKVVPFEPTPQMIDAAEDAHMPFGDMDIALRCAVLASPDTGMVAVPRELLERVIDVHDTGFDPDGAIMELAPFLGKAND